MDDFLSIILMDTYMLMQRKKLIHIVSRLSKT